MESINFAWKKHKHIILLNKSFLSHFQSSQSVFFQVQLVYHLLLWVRTASWIKHFPEPQCLISRSRAYCRIVRCQTHVKHSLSMSIQFYNFCHVRILKFRKKITFHKHSWFYENPWELKIYLSFLFHKSEQTWLWVLTELMSLPVSMFQNFIVLSEEPPPVARRFLCHGHQASALTAALCPWSWCLTFPAVISQIMARLSLLPEANPQASCFNPQISPLWPSSLSTTLWGDLISCPIILLSLDPVNNKP